MQHKFISKDKKTGYWKITNSKTGKSIKNFKDKVSAVNHLKTLEYVVSYEIKDKSEWKLHTLINRDIKLSGLYESSNLTTLKTVDKKTKVNKEISDNKNKKPKTKKPIFKVFNYDKTKTLTSKDKYQPKTTKVTGTQATSQKKIINNQTIKTDHVSFDKDTVNKTKSSLKVDNYKENKNDKKMQKSTFDIPLSNDKQSSLNKTNQYAVTKSVNDEDSYGIKAFILLSLSLLIISGLMVVIYKFLW